MDNNVALVHICWLQYADLHSKFSQYPELWYPLSRCIDKATTLSNIAEIHGCWLQSTARCLKNLLFFFFFFFLDSQRISVMTLIHKKDDKDEIGNYGPISLTNVDYRILAFVLENILQKIMAKIVNGDQTPYMRGR